MIEGMSKIPVDPVEAYPDGTIRQGHLRAELITRGDPDALITVRVVKPGLYERFRLWLARRRAR
jgi:hypothetical protein